MDRIHRFFHHADSLHEQIYSAILAIGVITSLCALIMTVAQHLGSYAWGSAIVCIALFLVFRLLRLRGSSVHCLILVGLLNFVLLPFAFLAFGGIDGGVPMFYLLGLFNVAVLLRGRTRVAVSFLSLGWMLLSFYFSRIFPQLMPQLSETQRYQSTKLSLFLSGTALVILSVYALKAYEDERTRSMELMKRLEDLSNYDPLTSLYNRRELFRRLELVYRPQQDRRQRDDKLKRDGCYVAMLDIDNFKSLNDTYGHQFGDEVLSEVAGRLKAAVTPGSAEIAARYGGEEFVCILYAQSREEAFRRIDAVRREISELRWEKVPGLAVTVSGGLAACEDYPELDMVMENADKLLYQSKRGGKNRISDHFDSRR